MNKTSIGFIEEKKNRRNINNNPADVSSCICIVFILMLVYFWKSAVLLLDLNIKLFLLGGRSKNT